MNNNSGPPLSIDIKDPRIRITFPDVAMRLAKDGPMYAMIGMAGLLAVRGTVGPMEAIFGAAFALQARSHPPDDSPSKLGRYAPYVGTAVILLILGLGLPGGCATTPSIGKQIYPYGLALEKCNERASTCAESIACENEVRVEYARPLRDPAKGCK